MNGLHQLIIRPTGEALRKRRISATRRGQQPKYYVRGEWLTASEIARRAGISYQAVQQRIDRDWPHDRLDMPRQPGHQQGGRHGTKSNRCRSAA